MEKQPWILTLILTVAMDTGWSPSIAVQVTNQEYDDDAAAQAAAKRIREHLGSYAEASKKSLSMSWQTVCTPKRTLPPG